ncbi:hypothetical protein V7S43_007134 [Phytophthora oleae]|uniref:Uncharacterized protein n=1 Tax=Phytophthora oleae TaxID=2107226 RepID=A0ABD3FP85_9STRA
MKPWQTWEIVNCKIRALKAMAWVENDNVRWDKIHGGARFGTGCDRIILEQPRTYTLSKEEMATRSPGSPKATPAHVETTTEISLSINLPPVPSLVMRSRVWKM